MDSHKTVRMRRILVAIALSALALALGGCFPQTHVLTEVDHGSIVAVDAGDFIEIRLPGNATTGYLWGRTAPASLAGTALEPIEEGAYHAEGVAPGSAGEFTFRYRAQGAGTVTLTLAYRRPWEPDPPLETFTVTIWVR